MLKAPSRNLCVGRPVRTPLGCEYFGGESKPIYHFTGFAGDLHAPLRSSFQRTVQIAQHLAARGRSLNPCSRIVWKFDSFVRPWWRPLAIRNAVEIERHQFAL